MQITWKRSSGDLHPGAADVLLYCPRPALAFKSQIHQTCNGTKNLAEILSDREFIAKDILAHLDGATDPWGIQVR